MNSLTDLIVKLKSGRVRKNPPKTALIQNVLNLKLFDQAENLNFSF